MAFRKKDARPISVGDQRYYWMAKGDDGYVTLNIMSAERGTQTLHCIFHYHQDVIAKTEHGVQIGNQFIVTPFTVRQVIEYGLENGWQSVKARKPLSLGPIDDKIDLQLEKYKENYLNKKYDE